ncbi:MAG: cupin domain-containing protein [Chromatiales bacterium]|jgi:gentisate 1,2-dioxygenase|nr:MAG: cupin domain-containing protein [Chromatiales bacterium]
MAKLATAAELPAEYLQALHELQVAPLWPSLRGVLPYGPPPRQAAVAHWSYSAIRPLLIEAGQLTPIEKAERRVLVMCNPGYGLDRLQATATIYIGLQLILPGEEAPNHRHSPSAIRMIIEGTGGYTSVEGEKLQMEAGDLILTPSGLWHEHGHEGSDPVVWMDALDLPLVYYMDSSYAEEDALQHAPDLPDASQTRYRRSGLLPYNELRSQSPYPMMRFPWRDTRQALLELSSARDGDELVHLAYVNPLTGAECLPVLGCSAFMLRPGETARLPRRTASTVLHIREGQGEGEIDGQTIGWNQHDIISAPPYVNTVMRNGSSQNPAFVFMVDDAPLQRCMKIYREFATGEEL